MKLAAVLAFLLIAPGAAKPLVIATTQDLAAIATAIAGEELAVEFLAPGTANTHAIELKPSYALRLVKADAVIRNGLALDNWVLSLIENSRNRALVPGAPGHIDASEGCSLLDVPTGAVDRSMGDVHPFGNPHYLLDPANGVVVAHHLAQRFSALFPASAQVIERNLAAFSATYEARKRTWEPLIARLRGVEVVTYHRMWGYFARFSGIVPVAEIEPKPGIPPSASHTRQVVEVMRARGVRIIVRSPFYEAKTPSSIAAQTGARMVTLAPQVGALPEVGDYWSVFDTNLARLIAALEATS